MLLFASAALFYLNSAIVAYGSKSTAISPGYFTVARAFVGVVLCTCFFVGKKRFEFPQEARFLVYRAIAYFLATVTFFESIVRVGPAIANLLNLTYPLFLAFFALKTGDDQKTIKGTILSAVVVFIGIVMVLQPTTSKEFDFFGCLIGFSSGLAAAFSIASLRRARSVNGSEIILLYIFGISLPLALICFWKELFWPSLSDFLYLLSASLCGVVGQYVLATGSKNLSATESGVISQSRILIAAICGAMLGLDAPLNTLSICGIILIFTANVFLVMRRT